MKNAIFWVVDPRNRLLTYKNFSETTEWYVAYDLKNCHSALDAESVPSIHLDSCFRRNDIHPSSIHSLLCGIFVADILSSPVYRS